VTPVGLDRAKLAGFVERFTELAAGTTTMGLLALADRTGLFTYLGDHGGGTADEIAAGSGLQVRYVREILSGLAAASIVSYAPAEQRFDLPAEHAMFVADPTSRYYLGGWFEMFAASLTQLDGVAEATRRGGGVPFDDFGPAFASGVTRGYTPALSSLVTEKWLPAVPGLPARLESGIRMAAVGGGTAAAAGIARSYPRCHVVGLDPSVELSGADARGCPSNLELLPTAVEDIAVDPPFDVIATFDVIHDLADPLAGLIRIREALAPGGVHLMVEPNASSCLEENLHPWGAVLYGISTLHCMTQSLARGGAGAGTAWGHQNAQDAAHRAGFSSFTLLDAASNPFSAVFLLTR
jgi:SAM-dependent methyltransferase